MTEVASLRVAFTTLGCKVNQSETDLLARQFAAAGFSFVSFDDQADVYIVNTCTVTHVADRKSRQLLNQARRANPAALVVAIGCYASIVGDLLSDDRTLVIRNRDKDRVRELVQGRLFGRPESGPSFVDLDKYLNASGGQDRSRAMVKAQDGCDSHCTYCIIPRARGRSRSVHPEDVIQRVRSLVAEGHGEIVITGVDLGSYGDDDVEYPDLGSLLARILSETQAQRVRVSSLEPGDFRAEWLSLWQDPRLCRHLHVPLQSGSRAVLQRMERRYSPEQYCAMVEQCRREISNVTITTDVMVGFPGETESEFEEGYRLIRSIGFDGMHVFKYSSRSGTRAAHMTGQVAEDTKQDRSRRLREEAAAGVERLVARHLNTVASVVWETERDGVWRGLTDTNLRVYGAPGKVRSGQLARARLSGRYHDGIWADPAHREMQLSASRGIQ